MSFKPTLEQKDIIKAAKTNSVLKVEAVAGSGKTATLKMVTEAIRKPTIYLAFNKAMATEASEKFPDHVVCRTVHSIAFREIGCDYMDKLNRPKGYYKNVAATPTEIAKYYDLKGIKDLYTDIKLAYWVSTTVAKFEQSADDKLKPHHVPRRIIKEHIEVSEQRLQRNNDKIPAYILSEIYRQVLSHAEKLWKDRVDLFSDVLITHDTYLKLFQLSKPELPFEVVLLDEAQDASPAIVDIVLNQRKSAKVILVGDSYQQIYQWRGAINAMDKITATTKHLTKSFRFGEDVAKLANAILDRDNFVKGNEQINSKLDVVDIDKPHTRLYRTNSRLIEDAVGMLGSGKKVRLEIDTRGFVKKLTSVLALYDKDMKRVKHPEVIGYDNFYDFMESVEHDPELKRIGILCKEGKAEHILTILNNRRNPSKADITLSTAHKSKGLEWDNVVLAEDFKAGLEFPVNDAERNLLYVAATRGRYILEPNEVAFYAMIGEIKREGNSNG